jgi:hypothetical protein
MKKKMPATTAYRVKMSRRIKSHPKKLGYSPI